MVLKLTHEQVQNATVLSCDRCGDRGWEPNSGYPEPCSGCAGQGVYGNAPWTLTAIQGDLQADWLTLSTEVTKLTVEAAKRGPRVWAFVLGVVCTLLVQLLGWLAIGGALP